MIIFVKHTLATHTLVAYKIDIVKPFNLLSLSWEDFDDSVLLGTLNSRRRMEIEKEELWFFSVTVPL